MKSINLNYALLIGVMAFLLAAFLGCGKKSSNESQNLLRTSLKMYSVTGVVTEIDSKGKSVTIMHEEVPNYMPAMTMPFNIRDTNLFSSLNVSQNVAFRLNVLDNQTWIDQIQTLSPTRQHVLTAQNQKTSESDSSDSMIFTNEFGQAVKMTDFNGQALAMNFFFTRCPLPNACPQQSKNFSQASEKMLNTPRIPTNWHFLSFSIDPEFDSPEVLRKYSRSYNYNSNHWTFLTGPPERLKRLAQMFGLEYKPDSGILSHGFRTVIITPQQKVQQIYPVTGDLAESIYHDMLKALNATNN